MSPCVTVYLCEVVPRASSEGHALQTPGSEGLARKLGCPCGEGAQVWTHAGRTHLLEYKPTLLVGIHTMHTLISFSWSLPSTAHIHTCGTHALLQTLSLSASHMCDDKSLSITRTCRALWGVSRWVISLQRNFPPQRNPISFLGQAWQLLLSV